MEEIAGGLKISASTVKKVLAGAGVGILALGAAGGGYVVYDRLFKGKGKRAIQQATPVPSPQRELKIQSVQAKSAIPQEPSEGPTILQESSEWDENTNPIWNDNFDK